MLLLRPERGYNEEKALYYVLLALDVGTKEGFMTCLTGRGREGKGPPPVCTNRVEIDVKRRKKDTGGIKGMKVQVELKIWRMRVFRCRFKVNEPSAFSLSASIT